MPTKQDSRRRAPRNCTRTFDFLLLSLMLVDASEFWIHFISVAFRELALNPLGLPRTCAYDFRASLTLHYFTLILTT